MMAILEERWNSGAHVEKQGDPLGGRFQYEMNSCSSTGSSCPLEGSREEACPVRKAIGFRTMANCFKVQAAQKLIADFFILLFSSVKSPHLFILRFTFELF